LKPGDILLPLAGQTLTGKSLKIVSTLRSGPVVVVFSMSRADGRDAQLWIQRLEEDGLHLPIYTVIFLESVPGLFRSMAVAGIKNEMPPALQDRTLLVYRDHDLWRTRLQIANERNACMMLLRPTGKVQWLTSKPFCDAFNPEFSKSIRALN
jgi:hypothetical protein